MAHKEPLEWSERFSQAQSLADVFAVLAQMKAAAPDPTSQAAVEHLAKTVYAGSYTCREILKTGQDIENTDAIGYVTRRYLLRAVVERILNAQGETTEIFPALARDIMGPDITATVHGEYRILPKPTSPEITTFENCQSLADICVRLYELKSQGHTIQSNYDPSDMAAAVLELAQRFLNGSAIKPPSDADCQKLTRTNGLREAVVKIIDRHMDPILGDRLRAEIDSESSQAVARMIVDFGKEPGSELTQAQPTEQRPTQFDRVLHRK